VIKLYMDSVHATCAIGGSTGTIAGRENIECRIKVAFRIGIETSTVYRVKPNGRILVDKSTPLNTKDLDEC
jgi:hypothetical protein